MTAFSAQALAATLDAWRPAAATGDVCVAFSGGLDSTVLIAALAELKAAGWPRRVRAYHIDHQLQPDAPAWAAHCAALSDKLGVPCENERVVVPVAEGQGVEAAARQVRYAALYGQLQPGETLLTAHHADDQLETVLLALLRGAGVRGLSAMPRSVAVGQGWHQRPLLEYCRADLELWAGAHVLSWVEDPTNRDPAYRRSYLRHEVVPALRATWPQAAVVFSRSAGHLADAADLLDDLARIDMQAVAEGPCLRVAALGELPSPRRRNLLRFWLRERGLTVPSTAKLATLERDMLVARQDRHPVVTWRGAEVRRHRGLLHASVVR